MSRVVRVLFLTGTIVGMGIGIADTIQHGTEQTLLEGTSFLAVTFGLLILSATAPTTLTEERVRGSLDVLLTTPLSTLQIVLGKWWAIYRRALPLVVLPALTGLVRGRGEPRPPLVVPVCNSWPVPTLSRPYDRVLAGVLPSAFLLAHAAAATSFGLLLATWFQRTGRAVAVSVCGFVLVSIGWIFAIELGVSSSVSTGGPARSERSPTGRSWRSSSPDGRAEPHGRADGSPGSSCWILQYRS